ncbi:MAG TPA: cellulose synthase operon protein YhjQ/BcsQ [Azospirillum sp.]|nr:cellulose synthase operon protein YhjQ/BcsQ [Azospirillum sp.]
MFLKPAAPATSPQSLEVVAFVLDADTERTIKDLVNEEVMPFTVVRRGRVHDAISFLQTSASPKLLIVDISGSAMPLTDIDALADACEPSVAVIVLGESHEIGLFRDLMQLGVADYLAKPITTELLRRTIATRTSRAAASKGRNRTGKIIACTGTRGGTGTTTLMTNLGWLLAERSGRRIALVDMDFASSGVELLLGIKPGNGLNEALANAERVDNLFLDRVLVPCGARLSVLGSAMNLADEPRLDPLSIDLVMRLMEQRFHYVMLDVPHRIGPAYGHLLGSAHIRIIVADPTLASVRETLRILQLIGSDSVGQRAIVVLNHHAPPGRGVVSRNEFEDAIGRRVDHEIGYDRKAVHAENSGLPLANESGPMTEALLDLVSDLSGKKTVVPYSFKRMFWS